MVKILSFVPFAFIAGFEGFALFAPYAALVLVIAHFARRRRVSIPV